MEAFLEANGGLLATILVAVLAMNAFLMGIYKTLEVVKDKTSGTGDDKAYAFLGKVIPVVQKVIDFLAGNTPHRK